MKVEDCIFFQLAKAGQVSSRFWAKQIAHLNVTAVQGMVLGFLSDEDGVTSGNLGERTQLDSATLTGIIDRLEEAGLIERRPKQGDRRAILVCLTVKGKKLASEIRAVNISANKGFLGKLSKDEEAVFRSLLGKIRAG